MLVNITIIIIVALIIDITFEKIKLPSLIGLIFLGILIGENGFNFLHPIILEISSELKIFCMVVILLRAGLGVKKQAIMNIGLTGLKISLIPCIFEGLVISVASTYLLDISFVEGGILGFIISALSLAVVVPQMLEIKEKGLGQQRQIPTMILMGVSIDNVIAITIYSLFMDIYFGKDISIEMQLLKIPISILLGIGFGYLFGVLIVAVFNRFRIGEVERMLILILVGICFYSLGEYTIINTIIGIIAMGYAIVQKNSIVAYELSKEMNKVWLFAKIILFVLIGTQVDFKIMLEAGAVGIILVVIGLVFRSLGVLLAIAGKGYTRKEKLFCVIAYLPKATVQAAIGGIPLAMGVESGAEILAIAVLSIIITAPLGSIAIRRMAPILLSDSTD